MIYAETSFDKAVDDALEEMSRKENKTMAFKWDEPRDSSATEDLASAVKRVTDNFSKELGKIGEQMRIDFPFMGYDDMYPEYGGRMRLNYLNGLGGWQDVLTVLIAHGYVVTAHIEDATETEREVDGIKKWVVIEFDEVE